MRLFSWDRLSRRFWIGSINGWLLLFSISCCDFCADSICAFANCCISVGWDELQTSGKHKLINLFYGIREFYGIKQKRNLYFLPSATVVTNSESCVDVMLPTDVMSVTSVVLGISRRTIGTDKVLRLSNGSESLLPSIQALASGPNFRINAYIQIISNGEQLSTLNVVISFQFTCSSASFSSNALRKRQLFVLTSRKRCSSSHTDESRRFFDIGRSVARIRLSTAPCGLRFISTN